MSNYTDASMINFRDVQTALALKVFLGQVPDEAVITLDNSDAANPSLRAEWSR